MGDFPEQDLGPGHEPTEEVGPDGCKVGPEDCEFAQGSLDGEPHEAQFSPSAALDDALSMEIAPMVPSPLDGLPIPADEGMSLPIRPRFSIENVVCIEDERLFVEVFHDELGDVGELLRQPWTVFTLFSRRQFTPRGEAHERLTFAPERVVYRFGHRFVALTDEELRAQIAAQQDEARAHGFRPPEVQLPAERNEGGAVLLPVRPVRERCKHYKRQCFANDDVSDPSARGHQIVYRNCVAKRSVGGAHLSVQDEAVYACDYRDPPEPLSVERHLDAKDRERLQALVEDVPLFAIPPVEIVPKGAAPAGAPVVEPPMPPQAPAPPGAQAPPLPSPPPSGSG